MKDEFFIPDASCLRQQSKNNKQGGDQVISETDAQGFLTTINEFCEKAYAIYQESIDKGVSREQSRMILPVNNYTEWYWKIDLHNLLHFLALRCDSHAQYEIRVFADAMLSLIKPIVPWAIEAWDDYHPMRGALKLTRLEVEALRNYLKDNGLQVPTPVLDSDNKREQAEWLEKAAKIGLVEKKMH